MRHQTGLRQLMRGSVATLLLIMFIDGVGMSLVLPLISDLFSSGVNSIIAADTPAWASSVYYALSLAVFSGAMVIGASFLGQLSDHIGRKKTLYLSLLGAFIGYLVCAVAVIYKWPILFLSGRLLDGLTAGSIPVAQAMLTDLDSSENKMTGIGLVMFAVTSGYMFGPIIANSAFFSHQADMLALPFVYIALLCLVCLAMLALLKDSKLLTVKRKGFDLSVAFREINQLLGVPKLRTGLIAFFLFQCAWTLFYQYLPQMTHTMNSLALVKTPILLAEVGIGMCLAFCVVVPKIQGSISPNKLVRACLTLFTLFSFAFLVLRINGFHFQVLGVLMAMLYAVGYSAMLASLLSIADETQKGLLLGSIASVCAISATVTALLGSSIITLGNGFFFFLLCLASVASLLLFTKSNDFTMGVTD